jgi:hypothetical protein
MYVIAHCLVFVFPQSFTRTNQLCIDHFEAGVEAVRMQTSRYALWTPEFEPDNYNLGQCDRNRSDGYWRGNLESRLILTLVVSKAGQCKKMCLPSVFRCPLLPVNDNLRPLRYLYRDR